MLPEGVDDAVVALGALFDEVVDVSLVTEA